MVFVFKNGIEVSVHANTIREHLFLVVEEGVGAEVIRIVNLFGDGGASAPTGGVFRGSHGYGYGYGYSHSGATKIILGQDWFGGRVWVLVLCRYL